MPFDKVPSKFKQGTLRTGTGAKVTQKKQALAIMFAEKQKASGGNAEYDSAPLNGLKKSKPPKD